MSQFIQLSDREWEVIDQLLQGKSNKLIASSLNISVRTVEFHLSNIYERFNVNSRLELILKLWKATGKVGIEELGYSTVDSPEKGTENGGKQAAYQYGRIQKTMRLYRIVLGACVFAIFLPLVFLLIQVIRRPESILIWRGILTWLLPATAILILLILLPRMSFQPLLRLAVIFLSVLLVILIVTLNFFGGYFFSDLGILMWLLPYLLGAGGILIAAWSRNREQDPGTLDVD